MDEEVVLEEELLGVVQVEFATDVLEYTEENVEDGVVFASALTTMIVDTEAVFVISLVIETSTVAVGLFSVIITVSSGGSVGVVAGAVIVSVLSSVEKIVVATVGELGSFDGVEVICEPPSTATTE